MIPAPEREARARGQAVAATVAALMDVVFLQSRLGTVELVVVGLLIWLVMAALWVRRNRGR